MRRALVVAATVAGLAVAFTALLGLLAPPSGTSLPGEPRQDPALHHPEDHESGFFAYLNVAPAFRNYSPVNVIVHGNTSEVLHVLKERSPTRWNSTPPMITDATEDRYSTEEINLTGTSIRWGETRGATRYAYVTDGEQGRWVRETAQLHDGTYFGFRHHIRLYPSPNASEPWVALQVHSEHFDWFTLRHAVDGVQDGQRHLEGDLMGQPYIDDVHRVFLGNDDASDSDGWATVIELAVVLPMMTVGQAWATQLWRERLTETDRQRLRALAGRLSPRLGLLAVAIVTLFLGLRVAGILLERSAGSLSMHTIAGLGYPVLAVGLPVLVYAIARGLPYRMDAAVTASAAMGTAILVDYAVIGVDVLPLDLLAHRAAVVVAIGLITAGATERARSKPGVNTLLAVGVGLWLGLLTVALAGWI